MREFAKNQINANTVLIGIVGVLIVIGTHKISDTFDAVIRFEIELKALNARMDRAEQKMDRWAEDFEHPSRKIFQTPKASAQ